MRRYVNGNRESGDVALADVGTPERWQHGFREEISTGGVRALDECMLDRWLMVGGITPEEHASGLRLRADFFRANVKRVGTQQFDPDFRERGNSWQSQAERRSPLAEAAYLRWGRALRAASSGAAGLLITVCCEDGSWPWARRHELRAALQILQKHYGY